MNERYFVGRVVCARVSINQLAVTVLGDFIKYVCQSAYRKLNTVK